MNVVYANTDFEEHIWQERKYQAINGVTLVFTRRVSDTTWRNEHNAWRNKHNVWFWTPHHDTLFCTTPKIRCRMIQPPLTRARSYITRRANITSIAAYIGNVARVSRLDTIQSLRVRVHFVTHISGSLRTAILGPICKSACLAFLRLILFVTPVSRSLRTSILGPICKFFCFTLLFSFCKLVQVLVHRHCLCKRLKERWWCIMNVFEQVILYC